MLWQMWNSGFSAPSRMHGARPRASMEAQLIHSLLAFGQSAVCYLEWPANAAMPQCQQLSPNFAHVTGFEPGQCFQTGLMQHFGPEEQQILARLCIEAAGAEAPLPFTVPHDSARVLEWSVLPAQPGTTARMLMVRDATAEEAAKALAARAELKAEMAQRSRDEFLANMSHELRTPLNAVLGFAQMMEQQIFGRIANPTYRDYIQKIQESGTELLGKISDLLQLASLNAQDVTETPARDTIRLDALVHEVIEHVSHQAFRRNVVVHPVLLDPSPILIGERLALRQSLLHILTNAVKHGVEGGTVQLVCRADRDGGIALHIRNKGEPISSRLLAQINQGLKRPLMERGSDQPGMGLAVANHYLRCHGGRMDIRSRSGQGTEVVLSLPKQRVQWAKPARVAKLAVAV